ncbi:hypothetical protein VKT23_018125 [Stygiomarasmius scandens]|uniref:Transposase n=1 Tax=Marasmiellus scandens TaxID=2682957 RepID=A0ABR1IQ16_9AGAR
MSFTCQYCRATNNSLRALRSHIAQKAYCRAQDSQTYDEPDSDPEPPEEHINAPSGLFEDSNGDFEPSVTIPLDSVGSVPRNEINISETNQLEIVDLGQRKRPYVEGVEDDPSNDPKSIYAGSTDYVYPFPYPGPAGSPLSDVPVLTPFEKLRQKQCSESSEPWAPFQSEKEWELARWLMGAGVSQKKIDEFCKLKAVQENIKPSYHNSRSFLQFIDNLERGPAFHCTPIRVEGDLMDSTGKPQTEILELWHRDPVDVVKELMGNPAFREHQRYAPVRHFRNRDFTNREYSEMWTCNWWWDAQDNLPSKFGTIAPGIIASDETQLSTFSGDKKAWPVYMSIGNIEKTTRRKPSSRAFLLIGYIPESKLECFSEKRRSEMGYQLFHDCMKKILEPLEKAGREGVRMTCADGYERLVFPLLAAYIADYPEQCLVCCCKENSCPKCTVDPKKRGELLRSVLRDPNNTLETLRAESEGLKPPEFRAENLRSINPFWRNLPQCNIFECITPDLLHQLHKGLFGDHVSTWAQNTIDSGTRELDNRFHTMTPHPTLRHFRKGISSVTQWTGNEYRAMAKVFPGLLAGAADTKVLEAVRAFEDFVYYAHFEVHTDESLAALDAAWAAFHTHKEVFQHLGIRKHFNISKLHNVSHYSESIRSRGTADGFNSESSERLHIDLAKLGYRASNKRHYESQMTTWLARQESVYRRDQYLQWIMPRYNSMVETVEAEEDIVENAEADVVDIDSGNNPKSPAITYAYAKNPPHPATTIHDIETEFKCGEWFLWYLREFLEAHSLPSHALNNPENIFIPVWKKLRLSLPIIAEAETENAVDTIYATKAIPEAITAMGIKPLTPARTSTVIVRIGDTDSQKGPLNGLQVARVRLLFKLPPEVAPLPKLLAFVDWYTPFQSYFKPLGMYRISNATRRRYQHSGIIFTDSIQQTCHLLPEFGRTVNTDWTSENILDVCKTFYVNPYLRNRDFFLLRYQPYLHEQAELAHQAYIDRQRARGLPQPKKKRK